MIYFQELEVVKSQLISKERQIKQLQDLLNDAQQPNNNLSSRSVQSAVNRVQREKDILRSEVDNLELERDDLKQRLQAATQAHKSERVRGDQQQQSNYERIAELESHNSEMLIEQAKHNKTNDKLRKELNFLNEQLREAQTEISKLRTSLHQYK